MALFSANGTFYSYLRDSIAQRGVLSISVQFRNTAGILGPHPFPAGLDDSMSGLQWLRGQSDIQVSKVIVAGDSGGANIALASAIKAKREGLDQLIDGVYALSPYIAGGQHHLKQLPSMVEFDGYANLGMDFSSIMASLYTPDLSLQNPLAWPYYATGQDLVGLPPHVIELTELDPLKDEGVAYVRALGDAGVSVHGRILLGLTHQGPIIFAADLPEEYAMFVDSVVSFLRGL